MSKIQEQEPQDAELAGERIRVAVRLRPLAANEEGPIAWQLHDDRVTQVHSTREQLPTSSASDASFHNLFGPEDSTAEVYDKMVKPLVETYMGGKNATILAYGQTSSGKTFTMYGNDDGQEKEEIDVDCRFDVGGDADGSDEVDDVTNGDGIDESTKPQEGLAYLAVQDVFREIDHQRSDREFLVRVSMCEIYNEEIRDLLFMSSSSSTCDSTSSSSSTFADASAAAVADVSANMMRPKLVVRHDQRKNQTVVHGLSERIVVSAEEVLEVMNVGGQERVSSRTQLNERSSRSHTIFRMVLESRQISKTPMPKKSNHISKTSKKFSFTDIPETTSISQEYDGNGNEETGNDTSETPSVLDSCDIPSSNAPGEVKTRNSGVNMRIQRSSSSGSGVGEGLVRVSVLNIVDLAGSERVNQAGTHGASLQEGAHINKSLLVLGRCIEKLSSISMRNGAGKGGGGHVPFRDSKLTRILQCSLGGNSRTAIICAITPCVAHVEQSAGTLRFASRACQVENTVVVNEVSMSKAQMGKHVQAIQELQDQLCILQDNDGVESSSGGGDEEEDDGVSLGSDEGGSSSGSSRSTEDLTIELTQAKHALEAEVRRLKSLVITAATVSSVSGGIGDVQHVKGQGGGVGTKDIGTIIHGRRATGRRNSIAGCLFGTISPTVKGARKSIRNGNSNRIGGEGAADRRLTMMIGARKRDGLTVPSGRFADGADVVGLKTEKAEKSTSHKDFRSMQVSKLQNTVRRLTQNVVNMSEDLAHMKRERDQALNERHRFAAFCVAQQATIDAQVRAYTLVGQSDECLNDMQTALQNKLMNLLAERARRKEINSLRAVHEALAKEKRLRLGAQASLKEKVKALNEERTEMIQRNTQRKTELEAANELVSKLQAQQLAQEIRFLHESASTAASAATATAATVAGVAVPQHKADNEDTNFKSNTSLHIHKQTKEDNIENNSLLAQTRNLAAALNPDKVSTTKALDVTSNSVSTVGGSSMQAQGGTSRKHKNSNPQMKSFVRGRVTDSDRRRVGAAVAAEHTSHMSRSKSRDVAVVNRGVSSERKILRPRRMASNPEIGDKDIRKTAGSAKIANSIKSLGMPPPPPPVTPQRTRVKSTEFKTPLQKLWG